MECAVIGAGVVGLACARALALAGREVVILEAERAFGTATSARNSEVIHAGLHYPQGSRKARLCARGKELLYDYCARRGVPHRRCEKLVVACSPDERPRLEELYRAARSNGVGDVRLLSAGEARALEPEIACEAALLSPSTGIVDSHALMLALLRDAEEAGAMLAVESRVMSGRVRSDGVELFVATGGTRFEVAAEPPSARGTAGASSAPRSADADTTLRAAIVVNCAGLDACRLAASLEGLDPRHVPAPFFAQGAYFTLAGRAPFSRLVYPVPAPTGHLGVHLTLDLAGQARFGPSFKWVDRVDYAVDPADARGFVEAVRRYWPGLPGGALSPGYAGVRPKISGPGEPAADFRIDGPEVHGIAGLVSLFGIESPGLTAALAIGEEVAARLKRPATT